MAAVGGLVLIPAELLGRDGDGAGHDVAVRLGMDRLAAEPTAYETEAEPEGQEQGNNRSQAVTPCRLAHDRSGWRHPGGAAEG